MWGVFLELSWGIFKVFLNQGVANCKTLLLLIIIYTFAEPITDEQVADLSVVLEKEGVDAFNVNNNEL